MLLFILMLTSYFLLTGGFKSLGRGRGGRCGVKKVITKDRDMKMILCGQWVYGYVVIVFVCVSICVVVQWNPFKTDTIGEMTSVLYMEVSLFQGFSKKINFNVKKSFVERKHTYMYMYIA